MLTPFRQGVFLLLTSNDRLAGVVSHAVESLGSSAPRLSAVRDAADCSVALRLIGPSLLVLDDSMAPDKGPRLLEELLEIRPGTPVVYLASQHTLEFEREVRRRGVLLYVAMPENHADLATTLTRMFKSFVQGPSSRETH
jgi:DNA-binding NtrC family response regulator